MPGSAFEPIHLPDWVWRTPETDKILSARDVGALFRLAKRYAGASQHRIAAATSIGQPRVNSLMRGTGSPIEKFELFERIADGLNMPDHARVRLGLAPRNPLAETRQPSLTDAQPPTRLPDAPSPFVLAGLRQVLTAYIQADAVMGALFLLPAVHSQIPVIERICHTARGADRIEALNVGSEFLEFCGWLYQDAGDHKTAMYWTNRAQDYALELGDPRVTSYILMRKSNISTDLRDPELALSLAESALKYADALTPRLRAVVLRQRANANAMLRNRRACERDSEEALAQSADGLGQDEGDRARYCTPAYVAMESGAAWTMLGHPGAAVPIFEESRSQLQQSIQMRDYALCLARLAAAYAAVEEPEKACKVANEALTLTRSLGSPRVLVQLKRARNKLGRWSRDPEVADLLRRIDITVETPAEPPHPKGTP